ncbi:hypothetical protein OI450_14355 [Pectobacterium cacticida]|uniref:Uncharacterized protein n=1 Tax=Pectobacterium cacticida TaxID=69221 RepID=A0ABZ2GEC5_9GAMM|nr:MULTISPECIES: hypothetical protein [Enterobacterales]MCW2480501.1 hypothetical protein [Candidatus Symbiopectobacterium sp. NZEC135]UYX06098.1 hypothetical protein OI450_14355 [Pectobacterium cacticida]
MSPEWTLGVAMTLISMLFGLVVRGLSETLKSLRADVERIKNDYQRREDARRDQDSVMDALRDLKKTIERIDNKLDRKADK